MTMKGLDPEYLWGDIHATRALVLALANLLVERSEFRQEALLRLEAVRTAALGMPVGESYLTAVDEVQAWLLAVTLE